MNRREFTGAVSAFTMMGMLTQAQTIDSSEMAVSKAFRFDSLPVKTNANGGWSRAVVEGKLPTGEWVEVHESMVMPGKMPHPPHRHPNSEFILLREGTIEYLNEATPEALKPGDVIYSASNRLHGMKNTGDVPAIYFVVSIGVKSPAVG